MALQIKKELDLHRKNQFFTCKTQIKTLSFASRKKSLFFKKEKKNKQTNRTNFLLRRKFKTCSYFAKVNILSPDDVFFNTLFYFSNFIFLKKFLVFVNPKHNCIFDAWWLVCLPANIYLLRVNNRNTRTKLETSKLIKTPRLYF